MHFILNDILKNIVIQGAPPKSGKFSVKQKTIIF